MGTTVADSAGTKIRSGEIKTHGEKSRRGVRGVIPLDPICGVDSGAALSRQPSTVSSRQAGADGITLVFSLREHS